MRLLTGQEAATLLGVKPKTLETWGWRGFGPRHVKIGKYARYIEADVLAWIASRSRTSTSDSFSLSAGG
jgi:predicted DNA-binding transcriptional regulator AlpA